MEFNATLVVTAVSFIIFIIIMNVILYEPILKVIEERKGFIDSNIDEASNTRDKASTIIEEKKQKIKAAHKDAKNIISDGVDAAKDEKAKSLNSALGKSKQKIEEQKVSLINDSEQAKNVLRSNVVDLAKDISEKLVGSSVGDVEFNQDIVDEAINNA